MFWSGSAKVRPFIPLPSHSSPLINVNVTHDRFLGASQYFYCG